MTVVEGTVHRSAGRCSAPCLLLLCHSLEAGGSWPLELSNMAKLDMVPELHSSQGGETSDRFGYWEVAASRTEVVARIYLGDRSRLCESDQLCM